MAHRIVEGTIPFKGYQTWYRIVGEGDKTPLLCLHGGPGATHDYLESLDAMADTGRRVIYYDQLGCGRSAIDVSKPELWTVELYVEEVDVVRRALSLDRIHLLGQSWGGMLAMQYMLTQPPGIASLTIASSPASMKQWVAEANRLREELPPEVQATLLEHEIAGTTSSQQYKDATKVFNDRHVCRLLPYPDYVKRSFDYLDEGGEVYNTMNGPNEFHVIGTIRDWDIIDRLPEIKAPTLVTSGRHDEATPLIAETVKNGIPGAQWVIFENSSHSSHVEEADRYMQVLTQFISQYD
ncbi:MAG: proline iminopeptidase-family hydrolase [Chloroflexi bacterium]|uniref:proline iminopeptidase-family hydrolase n=1 Tax=Candidatus Flexifilum breve TaxID=3140694 RepID=UPI003136DA84|nr:proline iminopeptidase-family hydrolase [Chloroflexota bacterium]